jgi:Uma2 family endonuclease
MALYAKAGIFDYWIFNLLDKYLKCYSELYQNQQDDPGYVNKRIVLTNQIISLSYFPDLQLYLSRLFSNITDYIPSFSKSKQSKIWENNI